MPKRGDSFIVELKKSHLHWGTHRYTGTRADISGEAYVPIPKQYAESFSIYVGSCYRAVFADGFETFTAKAAGSQIAGGLYAKQFQGSGDLKAFGRWYSAVHAEEGDRVRVVFLDQQSIEFTFIPAKGPVPSVHHFDDDRNDTEEKIRKIEAQISSLSVCRLAGEKVFHRVFKNGIIIDISGKRATVDFEGTAGQRILEFPSTISKGILQCESEAAKGLIDKWIELDSELAVLKKQLMSK